MDERCNPRDNIYLGLLLFISPRSSRCVPNQCVPERGSWTFRHVDDASLRRFVLLSVISLALDDAPLDDSISGRCVPWTIRPLVGYSPGRCSLRRFYAWTMRPLTEMSRPQVVYIKFWDSSAHSQKLYASRIFLGWLS